MGATSGLAEILPRAESGCAKNFCRRARARAAAQSRASSNRNEFERVLVKRLRPAREEFLREKRMAGQLIVVRFGNETPRRSLRAPVRCPSTSRATDGGW